MANQIYTGYISDPTVSQPLTGPSFAFMQSATTEMIAAVVQNLIQSDTVNFNTPYAVYGCRQTSLGAGNYSYTQGYVFFKGELFLFPAISSIAIPDTAVCTITISDDPIADPITFTDGIARNVNLHRTLTLTDGLSGSGDFNFNTTIFLIQPKIRLYQTIADFNFYTGTHTITTLTTPNDGITRTYEIGCQMGLSQTTLASTAQADCQLQIFSGTSKLNFVECQAWSHTAVQNVSFSAFVKAYATLPPDTAIDFKVEDVVSNAGTQVVQGCCTMWEL